MVEPFEVIHPGIRLAINNNFDKTLGVALPAFLLQNEPGMPAVTRRIGVTRW